MGQSESETQNRKRVGSFWIPVVVAGIFGVAGALGYYWFVYLERYVSTDDAYIEADLYPVNSRIMGYMKDVPAREGQYVKQGDILASMDASDLEFEKSAKEMKLQKASVDLKRARTLHSSKAISDLDLENAIANEKANEVDLKTTEIKLKYMKVLAPNDGFVAKKSVAPGQFVQPGQTLFVVVDPTHPWLKANFKETQMHGLRPDLAVKIEVDGYPGIDFHGHIESVYPSTGAKLSIIPAENATGNFTRIVQRVPVRISVDNVPEGYVMRPGLSARVEVESAGAFRPGADPKPEVRVPSSEKSK